MTQTSHRQLVFTVKDKCRVCYTCVRECPVKAIKIINGQAEVINERCIGCGNCVKVCSQGAKYSLRSIDEVNELLRSEQKVAACIAPSFPAEFSEIPAIALVVITLLAMPESGSYRCCFCNPIQAVKLQVLGLYGS